MAEAPMLEYRVRACRVDAHGSTAETREASLTLDTDLAAVPTLSIPLTSLGESRLLPSRLLTHALITVDPLRPSGVIAVALAFGVVPPDVVPRAA